VVHLNKIVGKLHPNLSELIRTFQQEEASTHMTILQLATGGWRMEDGGWRMEPPLWEMVWGDRLRWWCRGQKTPRLAWQIICLNPATLVSSHESNSHKINFHEVNSNFLWGHSHWINSLRFLVYKLYTWIHFIELNAHGKLGMFSTTLYSHTVRNPVLPIIATTWWATTWGGWLCSPLQDCTVVSCSHFCWTL